MDTAETAEAFTELLRLKRDREAGERFWAEGVASLEPMEGEMARLEGAAAIREKHDWWEKNFTVHQAWTDGPYVHGDQFACKFTVDATGPDGKRATMQEIGLYTVRDGKVVEERFFAVPGITHAKDEPA
jgi:hypothetical protein